MVKRTYTQQRHTSYKIISSLLPNQNMQNKKFKLKTLSKRERFQRGSLLLFDAALLSFNIVDMKVCFIDKMWQCWIEERKGQRSTVRGPTFSNSVSFIKLYTFHYKPSTTYTTACVKGYVKKNLEIRYDMNQFLAFARRRVTETTKTGLLVVENEQKIKNGSVWCPMKRVIFVFILYFTWNVYIERTHRMFK